MVLIIFCRWAAKSLPVYYNNTVEYCKPYYKIFIQYAQIVFKQVQKSMNVILSFISEKLPFISQMVCMKILISLNTYLLAFVDLQNVIGSPYHSSS